MLSYIIFVGSLAMQIDDEQHLRSSTRSTMSHNNARKLQVDARGSWVKRPWTEACFSNCYKCRNKEENSAPSGGIYSMLRRSHDSE